MLVRTSCFSDSNSLCGGGGALSRKELLSLLKGNRAQNLGEIKLARLICSFYEFGRERGVVQCAELGVISLRHPWSRPSPLTSP